MSELKKRKMRSMAASKKGQKMDKSLRFTSGLGASRLSSQSFIENSNLRKSAINVNAPNINQSNNQSKDNMIFISQRSERRDAS